MNENTIEKPMTLLKEDFIQSLVALCNDSGLPFFMIESILKDFVQEVHAASQKQYENDKARYEENLKAQMKQDKPIEPVEKDFE